MKPSDEAMLPCPFCGGQPYTDTATAADFGQRRTGNNFAIACSWCEVSAPGADTMAEAIAAWNTRAVIDRALSPAMDGQPTADAATVERVVYEADDKGLFCKHCGRSALRHYLEPAVRYCEPPAAIRQLAPRADDVAQIVAWLRFDLDDWPDYVAPAEIATAIERGEHLERKP